MALPPAMIRPSAIRRQCSAKVRNRERGNLVGQSQLLQCHPEMTKTRIQRGQHGRLLAKCVFMVVPAAKGYKVWRLTPSCSCTLASSAIRFIADEKESSAKGVLNVVAWESAEENIARQSPTAICFGKPFARSTRCYQP